MPVSRRVGSDAEDAAAKYLFGLGYTIITRRYKAKHGEIDIVALDGEVLVFIEVRQRTTAVPEESITTPKIGHVQAAAKEYIAATSSTSREVRFDVITLSPSGLRHHQSVWSD